MKTKRTKYVYSKSSQVYHLWANQSQDSARQSGRITRAFFTGTSAYSYGSHYEVGRILHYNGVKLGIVNNSGYSSTTRKHINEASYALNGLMIKLEASTFVVQDALIEIQGKLIDRVMNQLNGRTFWKGSKALDEYELQNITEFNTNCKLLGHKELELHFDSELISIIEAHIQYRLRRAEELKGPEFEAKREAAKLKREENEQKKCIENVKAWKQGYDYNRQLLSKLNYIAIRIVGNTVETSRGAKVPLQDVLRLLSKIDNSKAKTGDSVGSFTFNRMEGETVVIGCHRISLSEVRATLSSVQPIMYTVQGGKL